MEQTEVQKQRSQPFIGLSRVPLFDFYCELARLRFPRTDSEADFQAFVTAVNACYRFKEPEKRAARTIQHLKEALQTGLIEAETDVIIPPSDNEACSPTGDDDEDFDEDDKFDDGPGDGPYLISRNFWAQSDWPAGNSDPSYLKIELNQLFTPDEFASESEEFDEWGKSRLESELRRYYGNRWKLSRQVFIKNPHKAITKLFETPPYPSVDDIKRYSAYQGHYWPEVTAVIWRYLAIKSPPQARGLQESIRQHVLGYLSAHGLKEPAESQLKHVIQQVLDQRNREDFQSSILLKLSWSRSARKGQ